jgi:hypothetical protein
MDGPNLFSYCSGNPVALRDPNGTDGETATTPAEDEAQACLVDPSTSTGADQSDLSQAPEQDFIDPEGSPHYFFEATTLTGDSTPVTSAAGDSAATPTGVYPESVGAGSDEPSIDGQLPPSYLDSNPGGQNPSDDAKQADSKDDLDKDDSRSAEMTSEVMAAMIGIPVKRVEQILEPLDEAERRLSEAKKWLKDTRLLKHYRGPMRDIRSAAKNEIKNAAEEVEVLRRQLNTFPMVKMLARGLEILEIANDVTRVVKAINKGETKEIVFSVVDGILLNLPGIDLLKPIAKPYLLTVEEAVKKDPPWLQLAKQHGYSGS